MDLSKLTADRRLALTVIVGLLIIFPFIGMMSQKAVRGHKNRVEDWLPTTYKETQELGWFRHRFVADQFVIVSWEGCALGQTEADDDPRIAKLTAELEKATLRNSETLAFQSVTNGRTTLKQLVDADIPEPTARERLAGTLIGVDGKQTCVMAVLSDEAIPLMKEVIAAPRPATLGSIPPRFTLAFRRSITSPSTRRGRRRSRIWRCSLAGSGSRSLGGRSAAYG
jgi:uncharacterized protein